jgi:hypothetical protein
MNTTLNKNHDVLEKEIDKKMQDNGYLGIAMAYHDILPDDIKKIITKNYSPTSIDIRTRNDRVYVRTDGKDVIFAEMKTHVSLKYNDCCLELDPFVRHLLASWVGTECIYIYRNPNQHDNTTRSFYVNDDAKNMVSKIYIPQLERLGEDENKKRNEHYMQIANRFFHGIHVFLSPHIPKGDERSGDPYLVIHSEVINRCKSFEELFSERLERLRDGQFAEQEEPPVPPEPEPWEEQEEPPLLPEPFMEFDR